MLLHVAEAPKTTEPLKKTTQQNKTMVSEHHPQNETSPAPAANKRVGDSLI